MCGSDVFLGLLAILFPPIAVWVKRGLCSADSLINIALCMLGFLPGLLHAWYIIVTYPDDYETVNQQDTEGGSVTYYYVQQGQNGSRRSGGAGAQGQPAARPQGASYGTVNSQPSQQFPGQNQGVYFPAAQAGANVQAKHAEVQGQEGSGEGSSAAAPPSYADAVKGDNKIQSNQ